MNPTLEAALVVGLVTATAVYAVAAGLSLTLTVRQEVRRRKRERELAKMLTEVTSVIEADLDRMKTRGPRLAGAMEVDPESPLGQSILDALGLRGPCGCPNCEEERRIAHAEQQKRGEQ
ncbi:hypothetical protein [Leucobacter ruminantium]|uniref:Uncharacterized protein n=1 Tax=Leucobacter ruminantium TaxID=1289170 RepID=A0A939M2P3_9MICO|nr:hypothetical protein [Leucobacter ruminantium]MBO1805875.1 hypothetical protein [Leucobacter ruminantium]